MNTDARNGRSRQRSFASALAAALSAALASLGFFVAEWLDAFAECRVLYRTQPAVQGSLACQTYSAITWFWLLLALAACALTVVACTVFVMRSDRPRTYVGLAGWLTAAFAAAAVGAAASIDAGVFYAQLELPAWAPPAAVFGPVWTVLYALMGVAPWLVWRAHRFSGARGALHLFFVQLVANALWSWLFFAWRLGALAFVEALLLSCLVAATTVAFWRLHKLAATLLVPYLAWVTFASALTFAIWRRNPALLG